jgi:hypothetical protein
MMSSLQYRRIQPQNAHVGASFSNTLDFQYVLGSNEVAVWSDSYLSIQLSFQYSDAAAPAVIPASVGFANTPLHCFFSDGSYRINNREVSRVSDFAQSGIVHQLLTNSAQKNENNNSSNPVAFDRRWSAFAGTTHTDAVGKVKNSLGIVGTAGLQTVTISGKLPLFLTKEEIFGNTSHSLKLVIDPQWRARVFKTSVPADLLDVLPLTAALGNKLIQVDVSQVTLNLRTYESNHVMRSVKQSYMYSEMWSTSRALNNSSGSQRYSFTLPKTVSSLFFTFYDARANGSGADLAYSPTRFITDATRQLNSYEIRYANVTLPSIKYKLNLEDASLNRFENNEAFFAFCQETQDLSPNGSVFDATTWASAPIFYHQVVKLPSSEAATLDLELNFTAQPGLNSILYVGAFQPQVLDVGYNDVGIVNAVDVYQTSE